MQKYGDQVLLHLQRDNPLTEIHPWAMHAAVDAGCLAQQDASAYWTFIDYVQSHGQEVSGEERDAGRSFLALDRIATGNPLAKGRHVDKPILMSLPQEARRRASSTVDERRSKSGAGFHSRLVRERRGGSRPDVIGRSAASHRPCPSGGESEVAPGQVIQNGRYEVFSISAREGSRRRS